jgi:hypothetical protein
MKHIFVIGDRYFEQGEGDLISIFYCESVYFSYEYSLQITNKKDTIYFIPFEKLFKSKEIGCYNFLIKKRRDELYTLHVVKEYNNKIKISLIEYGDKDCMNLFDFLKKNEFYVKGFFNLSVINYLLKFLIPITIFVSVGLLFYKTRSFKYANPMSIQQREEIMKKIESQN